MDSNMQNELVMIEDGDHETQQDVRKRLTALINCAICLGTLHAPIKILACGHSYCYRCLLGVKESTGQSSRRFIRCPTCRQETLLPRGLVKLLPTNYVLQQLLAALNPQMDEPSINEQLELLDETSTVVDARPGGMYTLLIGDVAALEAIVNTLVSMASGLTRGEDWNCPSCNYYNYSFRTYCRWCPCPCPRLRLRLEIGYVEDVSILDQIQMLASISSIIGDG